MVLFYWRTLIYHTPTAGRPDWFPSPETGLQILGTSFHGLSTASSNLILTIRADVCGFFFRDITNYKPTLEILEFLDAGPPPIYIGFGSIVISNPKKMTEVLLQAIEGTNVRAIISRGWSNIGGPQLPHILYIDDCPHEWLFQHVSVVIHHSGAGTTACGLRYGKPTVIPFFGEYVYLLPGQAFPAVLYKPCIAQTLTLVFSQPFWGEMIAGSGAGPSPILQKLLDVPKLIGAINYCLTPEATSAASRLSLKISEEHGVQVAVSSFHRQLKSRLLRCDLLPHLPACWKLKQNNRVWHLSTAVAEILVGGRSIDPKKLKM